MKLLYIHYGTVILTTAVVAIIITAPLGAILINTLGIRWLSCDAEEKEETDDKKLNIEIVGSTPKDVEKVSPEE